MEIFLPEYQKLGTIPRVCFSRNMRMPLSLTVFTEAEFIEYPSGLKGYKRILEIFIVMSPIRHHTFTVPSNDVGKIGFVKR